jgi:RecA-family ATPase
MYQITSNDIPLALTGDKLIEEMNKVQEGRKAIAEGLIYEHTYLMLTSEPGVGKSTVSVQAAVELAAGLPVFGYFKVPSPQKVFYIQCERNKIELLERLKIISEVAPIVKENLFITDEYQKLDFMHDWSTLIQCIQRDCPNPSVIFVDPIYATIEGEFKDGKVASQFTKVMSRISKIMNCAMWYNHHSIKQQYSQDGSKITKDDPFYGSQWLKAHVTGSYYMENTPEGVLLKCKKDNYRVLTQVIALNYNPETNLCYLADPSLLQPIDRLKHFLRGKKMERKEFSFKEMTDGTKLCTRTIRELLCTPEVKGYINVQKSNKNKYIYSFKDTVI